MIGVLRLPSVFPVCSMCLSQAPVRFTYLSVPPTCCFSTCLHTPVCSTYGLSTCFFFLASSMCLLQGVCVLTVVQVPVFFKYRTKVETHGSAETFPHSPLLRNFH